MYYFKLVDQEKPQAKKSPLKILRGCAVPEKPLMTKITRTCIDRLPGSRTVIGTGGSAQLLSAARFSAAGIKPGFRGLAGLRHRYGCWRVQADWVFYRDDRGLIPAPQRLISNWHWRELPRPGTSKRQRPQLVRKKRERLTVPLSIRGWVIWVIICQKLD